MANERQERAARAEQMRKEREKADRKQRNLISVAIVVVVVALIAVAAIAINNENSKREPEQALVNPKGATKDYGIVYTAEDAGGTVPAGTKPVSVELYEDFQCPACLQFEQQSNAFLKAQVKAGAITVTFRPFSFLDENGGSPNRYSHRSTSVALCALDSGGVTEYVKAHDFLYANQPQEQTNGPENQQLLDSFKGAGIKVDESCVLKERFVPWVDKAKAAGDDRGVSSTPSVYVGGKKVEAPTPAALQQAIDAAKKA